MSGGRIRTVKPEWLDDELLASASDAARVLSVGLILMSDDHGRGRASIAQIASSVWKYQMEIDFTETGEKASRALRELVEIRFVRVYEVQRQRYFEIRNWKKHQRVDHPSAPRVPAPISAESDDSREPPEDLARNSRDPRETLAPDLDLRSQRRITEKDLPPLGRLLQEFQKRWELKRLPNGMALGSGWTGVGKHRDVADRLADIYAGNPTRLAAALDAYFASSDPFAVEVRWNFKTWANDPERWLAEAEAAASDEAGTPTDDTFDPCVHEPDGDSDFQLELHAAWLRVPGPPNPWPGLEAARASLRKRFKR